MSASGVSARVVSAHLLAPVGQDMVIGALGGNRTVVSVEEHVIRGGLGGLVAEVVAEDLPGVRLTRMGLVGPYVSAVGTQKYLRERNRIDSMSIAETAYQLVS